MCINRLKSLPGLLFRDVQAGSSYLTLREAADFVLLVTVHFRNVCQWYMIIMFDAGATGKVRAKAPPPKKAAKQLARPAKKAAAKVSSGSDDAALAGGTIAGQSQSVPVIHLSCFA